MKLKKCFILTLVCFIYHVKCDNPKHIVCIIADDVGRYDFGLFGSPIPTPNIDALAYNGITFYRHYTLHICTPSRAALLTGLYPIRTGMQGFPLSAGEPRALPLSATTIAERLLKLNYSTHLVGKWHLGHENRSVTPNGRGFQNHFGFWNGFVGYFSYLVRDKTFEGFDLHRNYEPAWKYISRYATDVFTEEANNIINNHDPSSGLFLMLSHLAGHSGQDGIALESPTPITIVEQKYSCIKNPIRKRYADIIYRLDCSVGSVVKTLEEKGILNDTIIVFMSDNGGASVGLFANWGSNWPNRGIKNTLWEGAVRNAGFIYSPKLTKKQYVEPKPFHITDWFPTLYTAIGGNIADLGKIDGVSHWDYLTKGTEEQPRRDILINIDEKDNYAAIMTPDGRYKLTQGRYKFLGVPYDDYYGVEEKCDKPYDVNAVLNSDVNTAIQAVDNSKPLTAETILDIRNQLKINQSAPPGPLPCAPTECLFDLYNDPTESMNIFDKHPDIVKRLNDSLNSYRAELMPQTNKNVDIRSIPICCHGTWHPWLDPIKKCYLNTTFNSVCSWLANYIF